MLPLSAIVAIVISRPAFSRADARSRRSALWRQCCLLSCGVSVALLSAGAGLAASAIRFDVGRVEHPMFSLSGVSVGVGEEGQPARILIDELRLGEARWHKLLLRCNGLKLDGGIACPDGVLSIPDALENAAVSVTFDAGFNSGDIRLRIAAEESVHVTFAPDGGMLFDIENLYLERVASLLAPLIDLSAWGTGGQLSGRGEYRPAAGGDAVSFDGSLNGVRFSSSDGLTAADGMALDVKLGATSAGTAWHWHLDTEWRQGEAYFHPLYLKAPAGLTASGKYGHDRVAVDHAALALEGVRAIDGSAEIDLAQMKLMRAELMVASADLAVVGPRFIAPVIAPASVDSLRFAGLVSGGIEMDAEGLKALSLGFDQVGFSATESELSFGPLNGVVPWRLDAASKAHLKVDGGRWQKLALGGFELNARMNGRNVDIDNVEIPVLDGSLILSGVALRHDEAGWEGSGAATVRPISMKLLTEAVGLPAMSGELSAALPGLHIRPGSISMDGALEISVFDGLVRVSSLRMIEPFGVASHLYADVEATHIDLAQLTETFSFGGVTGYIDAHIHALELARWRPVQFDARIASSPGRYPKRISQRAVQNISALGGAGAVAAIQRGVLSFFDSFGYRRIGFSCKLANGVCVLDGLSGAQQKGKEQFLIIEGGGVPSLNVIGYNRRMDWNELLDRLKRVMETNAEPVIE